MKGYEAKIAFSSKELSARDRVAIKDTTNAISLDEQTQDSSVVIAIDYYAILHIHNEHSKDKDYKKIVVVDKSGNKFVTGSNSFLTTLTEIIDEMADSGEEYEIEVYRKPSKNYAGKTFITCSIV